MISSYLKQDREQVMSLLQKNTPEFFDVLEEKDLENYLENEVEDYFAYE